MAESKNKVAANAPENIKISEEVIAPEAKKESEETPIAPEPEYRLKQKEGALHIGRGIFFYPGEKYFKEEFKGYEHYFEAYVEENEGD